LKPVTLFKRIPLTVECVAAGGGDTLILFFTFYLMMIPARFTAVVFAFFMSLLMAFIMSGILTAVNLGVGAAFFAKWMHGFAVAWACAFPTVLVVSPVVRRIVAKIMAPQ
jgi:hypothetical protein